MDEQKRRAEQTRLGQLPCPSADGREDPPTGVLLSDEIEHCVGAFKMIQPFKPENLKPAGYELTVGEEYVLGGETKELKKDGEIRIPPFDVVVIRTGETLNLPRFLIARWNIRVKWAYEGLLWVGAAQVDPGWVGQLSCPLYNLSDKPIVIRFGDPIALIDFVATTPFKPGESKAYERPPKRVLLEEYNAAELRSALVTQAKRRIDEVEREARNSIDRLEKRAEFLIGSILVIITVLFAVLAIFTTFGKQTLVPVWPNVSVPVSIIALALSWVAYRRFRPPR
jgi:deoxycytidine triphosphate deaminase